MERGFRGLGGRFGSAHVTLMGIGFGASAVNFDDLDPDEGIPLGAGIWTGVSMLISAFIGAYVTARLAGSYVRSDGMYRIMESLSGESIG